jgi:hypothetical protein
MTTTVEQDAALRKLLTENVPIEQFPAQYSTAEDPILEVTNSITVPHTIHVEAVDAAGNRTKSEPLLIYVIHEQEEEEAAEATRGMYYETRWAFVRREEDLAVPA